MKRINCGTDIALIGIWDISLKEEPILKKDFLNIESVIKKDSKEGNLFFIKTRADGESIIDIYVNEEIPKEVKDYSYEQNEDFLLISQSGKLKCDGLEEYRRGEGVVNEHNLIEVPQGRYSVKCYICKDYDELEDGTEDELKKLLPSEDIEYFDKKNIGAFKWSFTITAFVFLATIFTMKWYFAFLLSLIVFIAFFNVYDFILKKDEKYQTLSQIIPQFRILRERPTFVFSLKKLESETLTGGFIEVND